MEIIKPNNSPTNNLHKSSEESKVPLFKYHMQAPPNWGIIEVALPPNIVDYLWKIIEEGKKDYKDYKSHLVGHISKSFSIKDTEGEFETKILGPCVKLYEETHGAIPTQDNCYGIFAPQLTDMWCNYQYQTEFNPPHSHMGVWSFVIWMKIPYESKDQQLSAEFLKGVPVNHHKAGAFEFEYVDTLGAIRNATYPLSPEYEGRMVFFPSTMRHIAYPFFNCDEERISISGNIAYVSTSPKTGTTQSSWLDKPIAYRDSELNIAKDKNELTPNQKKAIYHFNNDQNRIDLDVPGKEEIVEHFIGDASEKNKVNPLYPYKNPHVSPNGSKNGHYERQGLHIKPKKPKGFVE